MNLKRIEDLITQWDEASKKLTEYKLLEQDLRQQIFDLAFPNATNGANKLRISYNMALVGRLKTNYTIDKERMPLVPDSLIEKVIRFDPRINEPAYRNLTPDELKLVARCVTEKPGMPTLEVKPQDKVRW